MLKDQTDLLSAFNEHGVEYLVIGGHAVGEYSQPRATKDLDVFIRSDPENSRAVFRALAAYGAPLEGISPDDFDGKPDSIFRIGVEPSRVAIPQSIPAVTFEEAWKNRVESTVDGVAKAWFISRDDLIRNKLAAGRHRDLDDVERIRSASGKSRTTNS